MSEHECPECRSKETVRHGFNTTKHGKFRRRKCNDCGHTFYEETKEVGDG